MLCMKGFCGMGYLGYNTVNGQADIVSSFFLHAFLPVLDPRSALEIEVRQ